MHNFEYYHFDTTNQWQATFQQLFNHNNDHPFSLTFNLPTQINKVKKIYLKSIELPVGFTNIRAENNSNTLTINVNDIECTIILTPNNYTITSLINAINKAIKDTNIYIDVYASLLPVFSIIGNKISVICNVDYVNNVSANIKFSVNTTLSLSLIHI